MSGRGCTTQIHVHAACAAENTGASTHLHLPMDITHQPMPWQVQLPWRSCPTRLAAKRCVLSSLMAIWAWPAWLTDVRDPHRHHGRVQLPTPPAAMLKTPLRQH